MITITSQHPIRTTLFFGLIFGLFFIPFNLTIGYLLPGSKPIYLALWLSVAGYSLLLSRWNKKSILSSGFPLLLLFVMSFLVNSLAAYYILSLVILSWIRSEICSPNPDGRKLIVESLLCILGGVPVVVYTPAFAAAWVAGIWMFFLIQALYFTIFEIKAIAPEDPYQTNLFERAARQAEAILSDR
jgi:hypothetical protein